MAKLRNPPPKTARITKAFVKEARLVANELHMQLFSRRSLADIPALNLELEWVRDMSDRLCAIRAWLNQWNENEKRAKRKPRFPKEFGDALASSFD